MRPMAPTLPDEQALREAWAEQLPPEVAESFNRERPIEIRPIDPMNIFHPEKRPPRQLSRHVVSSAVPRR